MISALMTVYNGEKYIEQSIESILNQTFSDFELIIVDDGSTDSTKKIIQSYQDKRITFIELKENQGVGAAIKEGLKHVNRDYIAKVDADDIYKKNRFQLQLDYLLENENAAIVDGLISYFPDNKQVKESPRFQYFKNVYEKQVNSIFNQDEINEKIYWFPCITHSTLMFRRDVLKLASYNENLKIGEDYDFYYRLNRMGIGIYKMPIVLADIRISEESTTVREKDQMFNGILDIKREELTNALNKEIYIWGTGELGQIVKDYLIQENFNIKGFIDNNLSVVGTMKYNYIVYPKEIINENSFIFIASTYGKFDIVNELKEKGFKHLEDYLVIF